MSWPLASHFSAMLQNPKVAFRDPVLQACQIEKDGMNQPRPWSGAFAVVYKGVNSERGDARAIRIFTTESPERRERYDQISEYLRARKLACLVDFEYRDRAIRSASDGKFYPLIVMDWVQGDTLFNWARARSLAGDGSALAAVAQRWLATVRELNDAQIAHGDLQHANVMVTDAGEVKLVDYDGMCVPALVGRRNLEVGVEPYQHPDRNETTLLSLDLDHYSATLIYVALRALAAEPGLWGKHVEQTGNDKLLFRKEDLRGPAGTALYGDLKASPDPEVRELIDRLLEITRLRIDQVPPLVQVVNSYAQIEQLLRQQEWEAAVKLLNRRGRFRDAPEELQPLIRQAYEYVCRAEAWQTFEAIPQELSETRDRQLIQAWNEVLFTGFAPAEAQRGRIDAARQRLEALERIAHVIQETGGKVKLRTERVITSLGDQLPGGYRHSLDARVIAARRRAEAVAQFEAAMHDGTSDSALVAAWRELVAARCDVLASDPGLRRRVELAEQRLPLLEALRAIPAGLPADQLDHGILSVWRDDLLSGCVEAEPWRPLYSLAAYRQDLLARLQAAVDARNGRSIAELVVDPVLDDYPLPHSWSAMVKSVRERAARSEALAAVLRDGRREQFRALFDARLVRLYPDRFVPYRDLLVEWTTAEILPVENIGLRKAVGRASLVRVEEPRGAYRVRWSWPQARFAEECLLAVCPELPASDDDPMALVAALRVSIDRVGWESGGGSRLLEPEPDWGDGHVVVWARVDLGFQTFFSQPLVLGQLEGRRGWKAWLPFGRAGRRGGPAGAPSAALPEESAESAPGPGTSEPDEQGAPGDA